MEKLDHKICGSCQTQNNPTFLFCWKCGHGFEGAKGIGPTRSNLNYHNRGWAIGQWCLSGLYVLTSFYEYRGGQKWMNHALLASAWFIVGILTFFKGKLNEKAQWLVGAVFLLVFGSVFAFLYYKKLM